MSPSLSRQIEILSRELRATRRALDAQVFQATGKTAKQSRDYATWLVQQHMPAKEKGVK